MILLAYLSKTGSTKEVVEEISRILHQKGLETEIKELTEEQESRWKVLQKQSFRKIK